MNNAVVAMDPRQMADAQRTLIGWAEAKLAAAKREIDDADTVHDAMMKAKLQVSTSKSMLNIAAKRVTFYEKVLALLRQGYYIIPPFNSLQVFAVRTARVRPNADRKDYEHGFSEHVPEGLQAGQGRWVDPRPVREIVEHKQVERGHPPQKQEVAVWGSTEFADEVGLPVIARKPVLINAVGKAMEEKVFDALGIAPHYRNADPIIAGMLRRPTPTRYGRASYLTFLVVWWLDEEDL